MSEQQNSELIILFPTCVYRTKFNRDFNSIENSLFEKESQNNRFNIGNIIGNNSYILTTCPELDEIKNFINNEIAVYADNVLGSSKNVEYYITQSWLNITQNGMYHHKHRHPNSIISGVFYIQTIPDDRIIFTREHRHIAPSVSTPNLFNADSWFVNVKSGTLVIFPSDLEHMVEKNNSNIDRISIAFNVFAKGNFGLEEHFTALKL